MTTGKQPAKTGAKPPATTGQDLENSLLKEEIRLPIVMVIQEKNHLLKKFPGEYSLGMLVETSTFEVISQQDGQNQVLNFIPIHFKRIWICRNPRQSSEKLFDKLYDANEIIWKTEDPNDPRIAEEVKLGEDNECSPRVHKYIQVLAYVEGSDMPLIISFGKSNLRTGETLLNNLVFAKSGPRKLEYYQHKYKLICALQQWKDYEFYSLTIKKSKDEITPEEAQTVEAWNGSVAQQNYQADMDEEQEEKPDGNSDSEKGKPDASSPNSKGDAKPY